MRIVMTAIVLLAIWAFMGVVLADVPPMPKAGQIEATVSGWTVAINALKAAWDGTLWIVPWLSFLAAQGSALLKWPNSVPLLRFIAGNYGHAANEK